MGVRKPEIWSSRTREGGLKLVSLMFLDFAIYESLNDGAQKFLGNDINDLGAHFVEDSLYDSLHKRRVRHGWRCLKGKR